MGQKQHQGQSAEVINEIFGVNESVHQMVIVFHK